MIDRAEPSHIVLESDGIAVTLAVRRNPRARRVSLRADPAFGHIVLVLPGRASLSAGMRFAHSQAAWIRGRLARMPPPNPIAPGLRFELEGQPVTVAHDPSLRGSPRWTDGVLTIGGDEAFIARRVRDWIKRQARRTLQARAEALAATLPRRVGALRIVDTRSRWGSCAAGGKLSFSWRLLLAPPAVLDYVVAHEVAHLVHPHHRPVFWELVDRLTPHRREAQAWLRRHGAQLLRFGLA
ncbi:MAG: M48 family metallopeptidase [Alphaproteobacteria bacterium]|nr:M48 family metallopeptidase [Alphaproteobacteria bacterium]